MVHDTLPSQDAFIHQIWNSYLKKYRRNWPDSMPILETRSEVQIKVTVTQWWYLTLCHPKMHAHTKFGIPSSNNMRYALDMTILKTRSEVKVTVTLKWYETLSHPMMHPHTKFGIPASKNIGDMHRTQIQTDGQCNYYICLGSIKIIPHKTGVYLPKTILGFKSKTWLVIGLW